MTKFENDGHPSTKFVRLPARQVQQLKHRKHCRVVASTSCNAEVRLGLKLPCLQAGDDLLDVE